MQLRPGDEGRWFAAAKDARLFDEAVALANRTPCDPKTLTRCSRLPGKNPAFAVEAGILAVIDSAGARGGFVARIVGRELGLP